MRALPQARWQSPIAPSTQWRKHPPHIHHQVHNQLIFCYEWNQGRSNFHSKLLATPLCTSLWCSWGNPVLLHRPSFLWFSACSERSWAVKQGKLCSNETVPSWTSRWHVEWKLPPNELSPKIVLIYALLFWNVASRIYALFKYISWILPVFSPV